ncbi:MAG: class I SAM-dependent methyltransferase [Planctomycetota bacterium]
MNELEIQQANRESWNETAAIHERAVMAELLEAVKAPDFCTFDAIEREEFERIGLAGKAVVQLACNNARELISVKRAGAGRCVGFDISDAFVEQAHRLINSAQLDVQVVRSSIDDISDSYEGSFDVAYITIGALGWIPSLERLCTKVARLLKKGGRLFVYEMHPVLFLYDEETTDPSDPRISRSYFRNEALLFEGGQDYFDPDSSIESDCYWFQHTLGQIITNLLDAGFVIERFSEYPHDISNTHADFAKQTNQLPMCFSLVAELK